MSPIFQELPGFGHAGQPIYDRPYSFVPLVLELERLWWVLLDPRDFLRNGLLSDSGCFLGGEGGGGTRLVFVQVVEEFLASRSEC